MAKRFKPRSLEDHQNEVENTEKKPPKKANKNQVRKSVNSRIITIVVWGILIAFFGVAFFFLSNMGSILSNQQELMKKNEQLEQKFKAVSKSNESSGNFDVFNRAFIVAFYNTKQDTLKYKETLADYFPRDTQIPNNDPGKEPKKITSIQQWESKKDKKFHHVKYLVQYQLNEHQFRELICFNVKEEGKKYVVQSIPYKKKPESMNNNKMLKAVEIPSRQEEQVDTAKKSEISNWLDKTFFPKYVETEDKSLVKYMMKNPEVLGGATDYKGIKDYAVYANENDYEAYVLIEVTDKGTEQVYENSYHLFISKDEKGQFFIDKLVHQFE